mmetsp:Transcript_31888/g.45891  ORF Transcript_31888/g.45891 Transcript_31888/m.45891 type:complete len:236 (-) Transcript_31888:552-1259(-)
MSRTHGANPHTSRRRRRNPRARATSPSEGRPFDGARAMSVSVLRDSFLVGLGLGCLSADPRALRPGGVCLCRVLGPGAMISSYVGGASSGARRRLPLRALLLVGAGVLGADTARTALAASTEGFGAGGGGAGRIGAWRSVSGRARNLWMCSLRRRCSCSRARSPREARTARRHPTQHRPSSARTRCRSARSTLSFLASDVPCSALSDLTNSPQARRSPALRTICRPLRPRRTATR